MTQQYGEDGARRPSLARVISNHVESALDFLRVALPGRIDSFNTTTQRAQVQPLVQHGEVIEGVRVLRTLPPILDVPIMFPGSGAYRITWPISRGDIVLLVFSSSSISRWLAHTQVSTPVDPGDDSRHNLSDGVAIPGLYNFKNLPATPSSNALVVHADAIKLGSDSATDNVMRKTDAQAFMTALDGAITTLGPGVPATTLTALQTSLAPVAGPTWVGGVDSIVKAE